MQKDSVSDNEREQEISNLKIGVSEFEVQKQVQIGDGEIEMQVITEVDITPEESPEVS